MCNLVELKNGHYVADIKLRHIENISEQASKCKNIDRVILFGSAIEDRCTDESDIDIAVFGKMSKNRYLGTGEFRKFQDNLFSYDLAQDYDILYFEDGHNHADGIINNINQGIEIYRRAI